MEKSIFRTVDEYGPIEVFDKGAKRYLTFGNEHEQSLQIKSEPHIPQHEYGRAIMVSLLLLNQSSALKEPSNICILGLGAGTLANAFLNALPNHEVHVVELRSAVIKIAQHYFQLPKHTRLKLHHENGFEYLNSKPATTAERHTILVADMYHTDGIDEQQLSLDFIQNASNHLSEHGILVLNYWLDHDIQSGILQRLHDSFAQVFICNSGGGNLIIYACKQEVSADYLSAEKVKPLAKKLGFSLNYYLKRLQQVN